MDDNKIVLDTNLLLEKPHLIKEHNCVILSHVLRELDKLSICGKPELEYKARCAVRVIEKNVGKVIFDINDYPAIEGFDENYEDNRILKACLEKRYSIASRDLLIKQKATALGINVMDLDSTNDDNYRGYIEVTLSDEEMADFYSDLTLNKYNLLVNQYIIIKDSNNEPVDLLRWDGNCHQQCNKKGFTTNMLGKFKPLDFYQIAALDSMNNNQITMIKGKPGSGKSLLALNYAWSAIERKVYEKLVIFCNPVASKNSARLGFYPGTRTEKILESQVGSMLLGKFGDLMAVEMCIANNKLILLPFSDIRGFDAQNCIVWFVESQNLDIELMKTGIQRLGETSKAIIDGDYNAQVDMSAYEGYNNGMRRLSEVFRGHSEYGEVELKNIYRSKVAEIADKM